MAAKGGKGKDSDDGAVTAGDEGGTVAMSVVGNQPAALLDAFAGPDTGEGDPSFAYDDGGDQMILSLAELLPDANGEVVLFSEAGPMAVNITTDERVTGTGTADHYVTSAGVDVSGYHFCTFEAGMTIYYPPEIELLVTSQGG